MKITALLVVIYIGFIALSVVQLRHVAENSAKLEYAIDMTRRVVRGDVAGGAARTEQMLRAMEPVRSDFAQESRLYVYLAMGLTLPIALHLAREFERRKNAESGSRW